MTSKTVPTLRVLLAEDVAADAELEIREIKRAGLRVSHRIVDSEKDFIRGLREFAPDVILSDFSMPQFDGMEALRLAKASDGDSARDCPRAPARARGRAAARSAHGQACPCDYRRRRRF